MKKALPFLIIVVVLGGAVLAAWSLNRSAGPSPGRTSQPSGSREGSPKLGAEPAHAIGNPDAPVMIEEFADFQCAACASLQPVLKTMKAEFGPTLVVVFRNFPIASVHANTLAAARAAEAAGLQGKFWPMHDLIYQNQKVWVESTTPAQHFEQFASQIGLDVDQFRRDVSSKAVDQRIALDRERAQWIGVNSTPTVFLNGQEIAYDALTPDKLRTAIKAASK